MPHISLKMDGDGAWPDLPERPTEEVLHLPEPDWEWAGLGGGMQSGLASVAIRLNLPDAEAGPKVIVIETSLRTLRAAVRALAARYPDPELDV